MEQVKNKEPKETTEIEEPEIKSVSDFIKKVNETGDQDSEVKKRLYRGLRDSKWRIRSSLELNMRKKGIGGYSVMQEYIHNQAMIYHAKYHDFDKTQNESSKTHLGSLAHMRHYGAATSLIDFTGDPLVALCFACQPNKEAEEETDGVVYSLDIYEQDKKFIEITKDEQLEEWTIDKILKVTDKCFYWKPPTINKRIPVQDSYFIIGPKNLYNYPNERISKIIIPVKHKQAILDELSAKHNISVDKFFDDLPGFSQLNSYDSVYASIPLEQRAENYLTSSIDMIKTKAKIPGNKLSEKENKELFNLYNERGNINLRNGKYYESIKKDKVAKKYYQKAIYDFTKATKHYKQNISDKETDFDAEYAEIYYNRGSARYGQKEYEKAIEDFKQALKIKTNHAKAINSISLAELESYNPIVAADYYKKDIDAAEESAEAYLYRGIAKSLGGKDDLAEEDFRKAIKIDAEYAEAYNAYGVTLYQQNKPEESIKYFNQAIKIQPRYLKAIENRGLTKRSLGLYKEAIDDFTEVIKINDEYVQSYYYRGMARVIIGEYEKAIKDYDKVIELEPRNTEVLNMRGDAKIRAGKYDEAIKDFTEAIKIDPRYAFAHNNLGSVIAIKGDYNKAINHFTDAIKINRSYYTAYYHRGMAKEYLEKNDEAIKDYELVVSINERHFPALQKLGLAKAELGEHQEAIRYFEKAIRFKPDYIQAYKGLASSKAKLGLNDEAREYLKKAKDLIPQDPREYYDLGHLNNSLGSYKEALECLIIAKTLIKVKGPSSDPQEAELLRQIEEIIGTIDCSSKQ